MEHQVDCLVVLKKRNCLFIPCDDMTGYFYPKILLFFSTLYNFIKRYIKRFVEKMCNILKTLSEKQTDERRRDKEKEREGGEGNKI